MKIYLSQLPSSYHGDQAFFTSIIRMNLWAYLSNQWQYPVLNTGVLNLAFRNGLQQFLNEWFYIITKVLIREVFQNLMTYVHWLIIMINKFLKVNIKLVILTIHMPQNKLVH